jgi:hypothetical protein
MTDITNTHLEAAILDQKVAGEFHGKVYAFVATVSKAGYCLGVAVKDEQGYNPIEGKVFTTYGEAHRWAYELNGHIGLSPREALDIIITTMRGPAHD